MLLGITVLAVSLSMDSFGIGISYGIRGIKITHKAKLIMCLISVMFTGIAVLFGNLLTKIMPGYLAQIVGAMMLILFGLFIIFQSFYKKNRGKNLKVEKNDAFIKKIYNFIIGSVKIIRDPEFGDIDKSQHIDCREAVYLGLALSIDSFGAGISYVVSGVNSIFIPIITAICQYLFLCCGGFVGKKLQLFKNIDSQLFVVISGVLLIVLAVARLQWA